LSADCSAGSPSAFFAFFSFTFFSFFGFSGGET